MQIETEFIVAAPHRQVWDYLLRTEEVVECIPGAEIDNKISDDNYKGHVTIKLGPLALNLEGTAIISERDHEELILVVAGKAKDKRGRGATDATVTVRVHPESEESTRVAMVSDLRVTGKIAQFGRGVMKDVSQRIAGDFAHNLEDRISAEPSPVVRPQSTPSTECDPAVRQPEESTSIPRAATSAETTEVKQMQSMDVKPAKAIGGFSLVFGTLLDSTRRGTKKLFERDKR